MKIVEHHNINKNQWDSQISESPVENIFMYSWYLDVVSPNWKAMISADYQRIFPLPFQQRLGVKQVFQPKFTRAFDLISTQNQTFRAMLPELKSNFDYVQIRNNEHIETGEERVYQTLNLRHDFNFKTNAKRIIKKTTGKFELRKENNPSTLLQLFKKTAFNKIETLKAKDLDILENLMQAGLQNNMGSLYYVYRNEECQAGAFFLKDKKRITLLKSAATDLAKKEGAMYFLFDQVLKSAKKTFDTFDFGGSNEKNVREFYLKFGACDVVYFEHTLGRLPSWYKLGKKLAPGK